jgi:DNA-binding CsgD family transcriptional regulator
MQFKFKTVVVFLIYLLSLDLEAQSKIDGHLIIDTAIWRPIAYLSIIPDLDKLNTMSNDMIIDAVDIDPTGKFSFDTQYFPNADNLFRIHIAKKSDPPASLIIGGAEENYFFLIANNQTHITVKDTDFKQFVKDVSIEGYYPNTLIQQINEISNYLDSTMFNGSLIKNDLIKSAIFERLRIIADTCKNPLVSLYAIYKGDFEKNYTVNQQFYNDFLTKWKQERSTYFVAFRKKIPDSNTSNFGIPLIIGLFSFFAGFLVCFYLIPLNRKKSYHLKELSIQERKIYSLILEGKSNKEISEALMIELSTVKSHVSSIYSKLKINSRKDILNLNIDK